VAPRTPADYPGRAGPTVVPNDTDQLDLDEKADRHRLLEEGRGDEPRVPWYRRLFRRSSAH
jgi:hypothetical protein